jgi:hypothetical protein
MIEAGERVAGRGAGLRADDSLRLAEWVELVTEPRALPYFVGHAFVRALQADLRKTADDFDCAQVFLGLMLRILRGSWAHLVGRHGESIMHPGEAIPRLYGLTLDIFAEARPEEVRRLLEPGFDVDVLRWLELGQRVPPQPWDEQTLSRTMNEWFTAEWHLLGLTKGNQEPLNNALHAAILQTHILNMTSGGSCDVVGIVPSVEDAAHACALDVDGATWWLVLNDDALECLVDAAVLVRLPAEAMRPGSRLPERRNAVRLQMHSFLRLRKIGDVDQRVAWFLEVLLEAPSGSTVIATVGPGPRGIGRAVLRAGGTSALKERDTLRELLENPLDCPNLSHWLEKQGFPILASSTRDNWTAHCARQEARRDQINKTILKALLSLPEAAAEHVAAALTRERMRFALIENGHIQDLMVSCYAAPILLTGPGAADTAEFLRAANRASRSKLGRPAFALENHPSLGMFVRYLGIWERPA